jgi:alkylation response protein AidB-like acyl-CoA dehydrogenase
MVSGECSGTMMLTEPDSGSDLSTVRTRAVPGPNGRWLLSGTKIFITWGQHDLVRNIFHLVLARAPDAPPGIKGISLFLVPRDLEDETGRVVGPNAVRCVGLEHKLGIHASPTCVMELDGAEGELVGPLHGGMAAMFSMMNAARLGVGLQGVSIAEIALQQAAAFAQERRQGRRPGSAGPAMLVEHPDVQRMLVDIAATVDAARLVTYATAITTDLAEHAVDEQQRATARRRVELLTPIAKAWPTDQGVRVASLALQVHGGMGFVEETGIAQRYRDARIAPIYEGTNGIQAIDLVQRKVARDRGAAAGELLDDLTAEAALGAASPALARAAAVLDAALADAREATAWIVSSEADHTDDVLAGATEYLELLSLCVAGGLLLRRARLDLAAASTASRSVARCEFFALHHVARRPTVATIRDGGSSLTVALPD